jgi:hypothetical protein
MRCLLPSISLAFFLAKPPQRMKTFGRSSSEAILIISSVNGSQIFPAWAFEANSGTVKTAFKSNTPCSAQAVKSLSSLEKPSSRNSFWILTIESGRFTLKVAG